MFEWTGTQSTISSRRSSIEQYSRAFAVIAVAFSQDLLDSIGLGLDLYAVRPSLSIRPLIVSGHWQRRKDLTHEENFIFEHIPLQTPRHEILARSLERPKSPQTPTSMQQRGVQSPSRDFFLRRRTPSKLI